MAGCSENSPTAEDRSASTSSGNKLNGVAEEDVGEKGKSDNEKVQPALTSLSAPLLIEEICGECVPSSYGIVLQHLRRPSAANCATSINTNPNLNKYDIIVLFTYIIMLELGFIPLHCSSDFPNTNFEYNKQQVLDLCQRIPNDWKKSHAVYDMSFILGSFTQFVTQILCTICTDDLIVNCKVNGLRNGNYSMMVDPSQYVVDSRTSLRKRYQNIKQFATSFKNQIGYPAKVNVLRANDVQTPTLEDLPLELKLELEKIVETEFFDTL